MPATVSTAKRCKVVAEDNIKQFECRLDIYRQESHLNFILMHLVTYLIAHIRQFGNIPAYSTVVGEASHREQIKVSNLTSNRL
jgi:hypothetical protein